MVRSRFTFLPVCLLLLLIPSSLSWPSEAVGEHDGLPEPPAMRAEAAAIRDAVHTLGRYRLTSYSPPAVSPTWVRTSVLEVEGLGQALCSGTVSIETEPADVAIDRLVLESPDGTFMTWRSPEFPLSLSAFEGGEPNGAWLLHLVPSPDVTSGGLVSWSLYVETSRQCERSASTPADAAQESAPQSGEESAFRRPSEAPLRRLVQ